MESLTSLASSLPTAHQKAEQELLNNFKSAALSITTLYRSSRETSKRAYDAGYAAACQDLLNMIQHGVSAGGIDHGSSREGMTIGRVMDWTEARLEALKQKDEEEDEEEDREKDRKPVTTSAAPASSSTPPAPAPPSKPSKSSPRPKEVQKPASPVSSPILTLPDPPSTTTSSPTSTPPTLSAPLPFRASQRPTKPRPSTRGDGSAPYVSLPPAHAFDFFADPRPSALAAMPVSVPGQNGMVTAAAAEALSAGAGAKRRHAMMMMLDAASPAAAAAAAMGDHHHLNHLNHLHHAHHHHHLHHHHSLALAAAAAAGGGAVPAAPGAGRRRERRSRVNAQQQNQAINLLSADAMMDVEEENGRERKRVARR